VRQLQNLALSKMRKALAKQEEQRTVEDIELEERQRAREEVIREFISARSPADVTPVAKVSRPPLPEHSVAAPRILAADKPAPRVAAKAGKPAKPVASVASPFAPKAVGKLGAKLYGGVR
jgi:RNA polymerase primary sigma factor